MIDKDQLCTSRLTMWYHRLRKVHSEITFEFRQFWKHKMMKNRNILIQAIHVLFFLLIKKIQAGLRFLLIIFKIKFLGSIFFPKISINRSANAESYLMKFYNCSARNYISSKVKCFSHQSRDKRCNWLSLIAQQWHQTIHGAMKWCYIHLGSFFIKYNCLYQFLQGLQIMQNLEYLFAESANLISIFR